MQISNWLRRHPLFTAILLVLFPSLIGLVAAQFAEHRAPTSELSKALYVASITLIFGGLFGGLLRLLLADFTASRQRNLENARFVSNVLRDLKSVYDRVGRVRIVIPAHRSAKTYGDEMRDLIQARVTLRNVIRALDHRTEGLEAHVREVASAQVKMMECYLESLTSEFRNSYKGIANHQRVYEANVEARLKAGNGNANVNRVFETEDAWQELRKLPHLQGLIDDAESSPYRTKFETPLDEVSRILREELRKIHASEVTGFIGKVADNGGETGESDDAAA
jgi:hypothetical protein